MPGLNWPALWQLARGDDWQQLRDLRKEINPRTAPASTVVLLAQAYSRVGDVAGAEQLLREASAARPDQVVLLHALGQLCELFDGDIPHRPGGAIACAAAVGEVLRAYAEEVLDRGPAMPFPVHITVTDPTVLPTVSPQVKHPA